MKQHQYKIFRSICLVFIAISFFILGIIIAVQPDIPKDVEIPLTLNSAALIGCLLLLFSLGLLVFSVFDIAISSAAINEIREEELKKNASASREEQSMLLLEKYKKLQADGIISEEEFAAKKSAIMRDMMRK